MDDFKTEKWTLGDGRRAERRVTEQNSDDGQTERIVELHVEDERPLKLQQRVVEKSKPIVYERKIETIDPHTGSVVDQKVESMEPRVQMQLVEHIASANSVTAQSIQEDCECHVTREEMVDAIVAAVASFKAREVSNYETIPVQAQTVQAQTVQAQTVQAQSMPTTNFANRLNSLGLADEIAGRVEAEKPMDKYLLAFLVAEIVGLGYIVFFM
jgi:hypothetical protein